jgi:hypothetical protein
MGIFNDWVEKKLDEVMRGTVSRGEAENFGLRKRSPEDIGAGNSSPKLRPTPATRPIPNPRSQEGPFPVIPSPPPAILRHGLSSVMRARR